jgi:hypothetical protein
MKLSKDELISKINEKVMDEDVKIELMEDITDSMEVVSEEPKEDERIKELEEKYKSLQEKYKERFLNGSEEKEETKEEEKEDEEELKEEDVIDVKEI